MIFDEFPVTKLAPEWSENELWVKKTLPVLIYDHGTGFCELGKLDVTFPRRTGGSDDVDSTDNLYFSVLVQKSTESTDRG